MESIVKMWRKCKACFMILGWQLDERTDVRVQIFSIFNLGEWLSKRFKRIWFANLPESCIIYADSIEIISRHAQTRKMRKSCWAMRDQWSPVAHQTMEVKEGTRGRLHKGSSYVACEAGLLQVIRTRSSSSWIKYKDWIYKSLQKYIIGVAPSKQLLTETIPTRRATLLQCQRQANLDGLHVLPCTKEYLWDLTLTVLDLRSLQVAAPPVVSVPHSSPSLLMYLRPCIYLKFVLPSLPSVNLFISCSVFFPWPFPYFANMETATIGPL
jgi:hypothetical protein